jgi:hypothetical protein
MSQLENGYQSFGGSKPNHVTLLPFTINGGPMDYHQGFFEMDLSKLNPDNHSHVNSTIQPIGFMYSPLQWQPIPENYNRFWMPLFNGERFNT